jgi:hypothetical protein
MTKHTFDAIYLLQKFDAPGFIEVRGNAYLSTKSVICEDYIETLRLNLT